jgi:hypothetical protein
MVSILVSEGQDDDGEWDTPSDKLLVVVSVLTVGLVLGGFYVLQNPFVDNRVYWLTHGEPNYTGEDLVFSEGDREMFNKVYEEVSTEYGWCLRVNESGGVEEVSHFASLEYATEGNISFSCFSGRFNGIVHTHPGPNGVPELSDQDRESLLETGWIEVSCVLAGEIPGFREVNPRDFACFSLGEAEGVVEVDTAFRE